VWPTERAIVNIARRKIAEPFFQAFARGRWNGFSLDLTRTAGCLSEIGEVLKRSSRPQEFGELEISVTPPWRELLTLERAKQYADLGVHRLIVMPPMHFTESSLTDYVTRVGDRIIGHI
jgi:hypothetical protein